MGEKRIPQEAASTVMQRLQLIDAVWVHNRLVKDHKLQQISIEIYTDGCQN